MSRVEDLVADVVSSLYQLIPHHLKGRSVMNRKEVPYILQEECAGLFLIHNFKDFVKEHSFYLVVKPSSFPRNTEGLAWKPRTQNVKVGHCLYVDVMNIAVG